MHPPPPPPDSRLKRHPKRVSPSVPEPASSSGRPVKAARRASTHPPQPSASSSSSDSDQPLRPSTSRPNLSSKPQRKSLLANHHPKPEPEITAGAVPTDPRSHPSNGTATADRRRRRRHPEPQQQRQRHVNHDVNHDDDHDDDDDDDDDDDVPLSAAAASIARAAVKAEPEGETEILPSSNGRPSSADATDAGKYRWWDDGANPDDKTGNKWSTLSHNAVIFPPEYEPHGLPIMYNGSTPIHLPPKAEEIATFYAAKLATDYVKSDTFNRNFFEDFRLSLKGTPLYKRINRLDRCDFTQIYDLLEKRKAEKKELPPAERKKIRDEETLRCKKYTVALVDGREEKVGNFRVEPPGLFLGRGEHPKRGKVKARIFPEDITINVGEDDPVPPCPMDDHSWGNIVHKHDVTWLCGWKDTITGGSKYVWLAAGSAFKGMSDHAKFEKARKLKHHIDKIRRDYRDGFKSRVKEVRQRSVAMYLIDKLALRVGNEKGDEEADTVGCCSLRVEHIDFQPEHTVVFDFLGKDSIRYYNTVKVEKPVYESLKLFCRNKQPSEEIFHRLTVTSLNDYLKSLMDGLSAKVFRTFNASITLDDLLQEMPQDADINEKIVFYNKQNKEVAILCNHQRSLPKAHGAQMEKMESKLTQTVEWQAELVRGQNLLADSKDPNATVDLTEYVHEKPQLTEDMDDKARADERKRAAEAPRVAMTRTRKLSQIDGALKKLDERLSKMRADMQVKEDLKTVALGTSKINYLDPRITVAWCKKHDVPIERIFAKTLLVKFAWAMEVSENFRF